MPNNIVTSIIKSDWFDCATVFINGRIEYYYFLPFSLN
jgi:hypothetical protein